MGNKDPYEMAKLCIKDNVHGTLNTAQCADEYGVKSVIPLFKKQIMQGGPITVTHPNIKLPMNYT